MHNALQQYTNKQDAAADFNLKIMELTKNYIPSAVEDKWYRHWLTKRYFNSTPDERPAYTVVIPPPNVTGVLHMGHTLNENGAGHPGKKSQDERL